MTVYFFPNMSHFMWPSPREAYDEVIKQNETPPSQCNHITNLSLHLGGESRAEPSWYSLETFGDMGVCKALKER
jgi:hypothetical protein